MLAYLREMVHLLFELTMNLTVLYAFQNEHVSLIEVKRLDLSSDAPPGEVYHWLLIEPPQRVSKLNFKSMSSSDGTEFREFMEGSLSFNPEVAELGLKGKIIHLRAAKVTSEENLGLACYYLGMS